MSVSRWGILLIDICIVIFSIALAHLLRFNFELDALFNTYTHLSWGVPLLVGLRVICFLYFKTYTGIIFYTGIEDAKRIFYAAFVSSFIFALIVNPLSQQFTKHFALSYSVLTIDFLITIFFMTAYRALTKVLYIELTNGRKERKKLIIYGAGQEALMIKQVMDRDTGTNYTVNAFIDDDEKMRKKRMFNIPIFSSKKLERVILGSQPDFLVIAKNTSRKKKEEIVELCLKNQVKVLNVPPMDAWINGELSFKQIKEIKIEDLLERKPIELDLENIKNKLAGKIILITGAAGSIGSELVRQAISFNPQQIILLEQAETPLYNLGIELKLNYAFKNYELVIGDVRNRQRMKRLFEHYRPDIVFHAAAYKHVPLMEHNPSEAILTNIKGTKILADMAVKFKTRRFVLVSTDKAVNPTSIMGASKRLAEIYVQSYNQYLQDNKRPDVQKTRFITTRFGNVLGSNGSVIPLFKKQIEEGGPVTVTHPEMTRYFMTIPEACLLVMEAGVMGKGGEIFVFDMGKSIKIVDLAKKMVALSGLELGKDIDITFTGLRPGEKLFEELLNKAETTLPTHNKQIMIAKVREYEYEEVEQQIEELIFAFNSQDNKLIVKHLKDIIPEFISNNSIFEELDL